MTHIRECVAEVRAQARALPPDDARRVATLSLLAETDALLDAADRKLGRAAREFETVYDVPGAPLRGGWSIARN